MEKDTVKRYTSALREQNYDKALKIAEDLVKEYIELDFNYSEIARENNLTRERVGQIYGTIFGDRQFADKLTEDFNWKAIKDLTETLGITQAEIAKESGISRATVVGVLNGDPTRTAKLKRKSSNPPAKIKVIKTILKMIKNKLYVIGEEISCIQKEVNDIDQNT
ncbi:MAG: helix-turn-helix domain-containing protein [Candidatus Dojkabacteria bacterium]